MRLIYIFLSFLLLSHVHGAEEKKVAIVMYGLNVGGAERALVNMLNYSEFPASKVDFCYVNRDGAFFDILNKNISVIPLQEAQKRQYDIVISYLEAMEPSCWVHQIHARKYIQWIHTDLRTCLWKPPVFYKNKCQGIDTFVCVSEATKKSFIAVHPELASKVEVIFNIVNEDVIRKEASVPVQDVAKEEGVLNIVSVGRLATEKGIERALSVCKRLVNDGFRFRWYVVGEGPNKAALAKSIIRNNLQDSFILLGARLNPYPYFKMADIFVLPSLLEGRSVVVSEAQILALPILATDVGGIHEQLVDGENGSIVANSEDGIYEGVRFLIEHPEVREKYRKALKNFTYDNSASVVSLEKLFK